MWRPIGTAAVFAVKYDLPLDTAIKVLNRARTKHGKPPTDSGRGEPTQAERDALEQAAVCKAVIAVAADEVAQALEARATAARAQDAAVQAAAAAKDAVASAAITADASAAAADARRADARVAAAVDRAEDAARLYAGLVATLRGDSDAALADAVDEAGKLARKLVAAGLAGNTNCNTGHTWGSPAHLCRLFNERRAKLGMKQLNVQWVSKLMAEKHADARLRNGTRPPSPPAARDVDESIGAGGGECARAEVTRALALACTGTCRLHAFAGLFAPPCRALRVTPSDILLPASPTLPVSRSQ
jgi:hypothetical protein